MVWQWPECDEAFADRFYACCACAFAQLVLSMYWFHISFYSETSKCWDRMGWFVHTFVAVLNLIVIPIFCMVNMSLSYSEEYARISPYQLVIVSYSCTAVLFAVRMLLSGKKIFYDTWCWYQNRHGKTTDANQIQVQSSSMKSNGKDEQPVGPGNYPELPFLDY